MSRLPDDSLLTRRTLLSRLRDLDDQESWRTFFDLYWQLIYNVARKAGLDDATAQEIVQDAVIAVARKMPEFRYDPARGTFRQWLLRITRRRIVDHLRRIYRQPPKADLSPESLDDNDEYAAAITDQNASAIEVAWNEEWEKATFEAAHGEDWKCPSCARPFRQNQGVLSFLTPEERFNESDYEADQIAAWTASARLRDKIRSSKLLTFLNRLRIRFSFSGRRDRVFLNEMQRGTGPEKLILDLGCGGGRHYFCDYGKVIGIDPVLPLLKMAGKVYDEVYQTSGFKLPFADESFDYVVSSDVLGHIGTENKDLLFSEIRRVLKKGGRTVHCSKADADNIWFRFAHRYPELFNVFFVDKPGHISLERPTRIRERFLKHGFREIAFQRLSGTLQVPGTHTAMFDNEYRRKSKWISVCVAIDKVLNANFTIREALNFLLEALARLEDWLTPLDCTSGALVVYEKA